MIVATVDGRLRCVTQCDHARFAAQLLELWREPPVAEHPHRAELLAAVREHDDVWQGADAAPRVHRETGRPHDFRTLPDGERLEIWRRGARRWPARNPYVTALVLQHAIQLHRNREGDGWDEALDTWRDQRDQSLEAAGLDRDEADRDFEWLELADALSILATESTRGSIEIRGRRASMRDRGLEIDPFPLAGATTFDVPCRWIDDRPYARDAELAVELASARWTSFPLRVVPPVSD